MTTSVQLRMPLSGSPRHSDLVHGYVRTTTHNPAHSEAAIADIRQWCASAGHTLGSVLVDSGVPDDGGVAPGFAALVVGARAGRCSIAVVAHVHHLSWRVDRAESMARELWEHGARIVVADGLELTPGYFDEVRALRADDGPERWELCANLLASLPDEGGRRSADGVGA